MELICNQRDLRRAYETLLFLKEIEREHGSSENLKIHSNDLKKAIRKYFHRKTDRRLVKDYGIDGYIELIKLPEYLETKEDAKEYFDSEERMVCRPSAFDCTGQSFTSWYKIFKRRGQFYAYHSVSVDV